MPRITIELGARLYLVAFWAATSGLRVIGILQNAVMSGVSIWRRQFQVLDSVVGFVVVLVVNHFMSLKAATKVALHDKPVFKDAASVYEQQDVTAANNCACAIGPIFSHSQWLQIAFAVARG